MALDPSLAEIAAAGHRRWCERMRQEGWSEGTVYDEHRRQHDALVPFEKLSNHMQMLLCRGVQAGELPLLLDEALKYEYDRGPEREFSLDELRAGLPVTWATWVTPVEPRGLRFPIVEERGQIESWEIDQETGEISLIWVRWEDGELSEHYAAERDLRRLSDP